MAVNVKMGVDIGAFTSGIKQGQQILKGLNAEMKASEAEFKATGDAEKKLSSQTKTLNSQLNVQKGIADQAKQALKTMTDQGVDPADAAYQKLYVTLLNAEAGANEAQAALNQLGQGTEKAADGADKLASGLSGISKKMSLDQVISGINTITSGLENAAQKAIRLGETIWDAIMDKAQWADDTATMAQMYGIDLDTYQRMQKLVTNGLDTTVEAMIKSQKKLRKGIGEESQATMEALTELGLAFSSGKDGAAQLITDDEVDLFWRAGQALMNMSDAYDKEATAQALFGRSWEELVPLFTEFKSAEEYQKALESVQVVSEEDVEALAELNDKVSELKGNLDTLSTDILATLAPALTDAANALNGLLTRVIEYLQTDEGKQALKDMETAVSGLFDDLGKIDPESVVSGFTDVFNTVVGSLQWLVNNKETVQNALIGIVTAWGAMKIGAGVLTIIKLIDGLKQLGIIGGGSSAAEAAASGTSGGLFSNLSTKLEGVLPNLVQGQGTSFALGFTMDNFDLLKERENYIKQVISDYGLDIENSDVFGAAMRAIMDKGIYTPDDVHDLPEGFLEELEGLKIQMEPTVPEDAAENIAEQVGEVTIPANLQITGISGGGLAGGGGGLVNVLDKWFNMKTYANGINYVPYDGMLARLHKGERVTTAREVQSRSYNSNLYVESMYMNNGTDAAGLAAAMAAAQRRQISGYGS